MLNSPKHIQQEAIGYCLPACVQMALTQWNIRLSQRRLAQLLDTRKGIGTPFSRLAHLPKSLPIKIQLSMWASSDELTVILEEDVSIIVPLVTSSALPGWNDALPHTVLVSSIFGEQIAYFDPALSYGPVKVAFAEFLLAWDEMEARFACLSQEKH